MEDRVTQQKRGIKLADGKEYEIKALTLKESKEIIPTLAAIEELSTKADGKLTPELVDVMADLCLVILKKSIEGLTKEKVLDLVDLENVQTLILMASGRI